MKNIKPSGIRSVSHYVASPVETCDCCSAAIKLVSVVTYQDGTRVKYGCKCIEKALSGDTSMVSLYRKNIKLLQKLQRYLEIFNLPEDQMPVSSYFDRGYYMIADDNGRAICLEHYTFHPSRIDQKAIDQMDGAETLDMRSCGRSCWEPNTLENHQIKFRAAFERDREYLKKEIARVEGFLARVLAKGLVKA